MDDTPAHPVKPQRLGIKVNAAIACVAVGLAVRFLVPMPAGVTGEAWTLLAIFCTTIAGAELTAIRAYQALAPTTSRYGIHGALPRS